MHLWWSSYTLRMAHQNWQALVGKREAARCELERRYLSLRREAEGVQINPRLGLLRTAQTILDRPMDEATLKAHNRLKNAFVNLGISFFRRAPESIREDITLYSNRIEEICQRHGALGCRLQHAQQIIHTYRQHSDFGDTHSLRLAVISPEVAEVLFHRWQGDLINRQAILDCLTRSWQTRVVTCQGWFDLIKEKLGKKNYKKYAQELRNLADKAAAEQGATGPELISYHSKLDPLIEMANRQALQISAKQAKSRLLKMP